MYGITMDIMIILLSSTEVPLIQYHSKPWPHIICSSVLYVFSALFSGGCPNIANMDIVENVSLAHLEQQCNECCCDFLGACGCRNCFTTDLQVLVKTFNNGWLPFLQEYHTGLLHYQCFEIFPFKSNKTVSYSSLVPSYDTVIIVVWNDIHCQRTNNDNTEISKMKQSANHMLNGKCCQSEQPHFTGIGSKCGILSP